MKIWVYRFILLLLLFGVSALPFKGDQMHPLLTIITNVSGLAGAAFLLVFYFYYPPAYKLLAWVITAGAVFLVLESLYTYNQYMYSFFVVKRFAYCGLALLTFFVATQAGPSELKLSYAVNLIFLFYFINQILLGQIFSYSLTNESRTTSAYESFFLVLPFAYFLVRYLNEHKRIDLLKAIGVFGLIVFLLHRSVITTAVMAAGLLVLLSVTGKVANSRLQIRRTVSTLLVLVLMGLPFLGILSPKRTDAFLETIGGIFAPSEDETGSWRIEQSKYYMARFDERPLLGWRYEGYDRGEVMVHEDFAEKGTVIHSQYVDMLYNYGAVGLGINLFLVFSTLAYMYLRNRTFSTEQAVLFGFIASGLLFGVSYQLPVFYWSFVGLGMFYGKYQKPAQPLLVTTDVVLTEVVPVREAALPKTIQL